MALSQQDIVKIANLSRLEMSASEREKMQGQINRFLDVVEQMRAVDTAGIEPLAHPTHAMPKELMPRIQLRLRDDVVSQSNRREANQQSAPAVERGLLLVPKVIE